LFGIPGRLLHYVTIEALSWAWGQSCLLPIMGGVFRGGYAINYPGKKTEFSSQMAGFGALCGAISNVLQFVYIHA